MRQHFLGLAACLTLLAFAAPSARADEAAPKRSPYVGPNVCMDCHQVDFDVWKETKHATGFRTVHRSETAKKVLDAVGGETNIRNHATCQVCHFVSEVPAGGDKPVAIAGVTCERCHGAALKWVGVHNALGDMKLLEPAEHKAKRIADAKAAGMIRPDMTYDLGANCNSCHGLANPAVEPAVFAKMLAAGHPFDPEFELVKYSQGSIRHRFYPPSPTVNQEMSAAEQARMFAVGQAVKLVSATAASARGDNADYKAAQAKRIDSAKKALGALKSVPEAAALLKDPSEANGRALAAAVKDKDLSAELKDLLPAKSDLK